MVISNILISMDLRCPVNKFRITDLPAEGKTLVYNSVCLRDDRNPRPIHHALIKLLQGTSEQGTLASESFDICIPTSIPWSPKPCILLKQNAAWAAFSGTITRI